MERAEAPVDFWGPLPDLAVRLALAFGLAPFDELVLLLLLPREVDLVVAILILSIEQSLRRLLDTRVEGQ